MPAERHRGRALFRWARSPVTMACTKNPNMENMARRPFLISLTLSSAKVSGSSARPRGSKGPPAAQHPSSALLEVALQALHILLRPCQTHLSVAARHLVHLAHCRAGKVGVCPSGADCCNPGVAAIGRAVREEHTGVEAVQTLQSWALTSCAV